MVFPSDWLLEGPAFVRLRILLDIEKKGPDEPEVTTAYREMIEDPSVRQLIEKVNDWEKQYPIKRHNDAVHPLHRLVFAAAIGVKKVLLMPALESILSHQSSEGPFQIRIVVPRAFGGDDVPKWDWVATDAPLILYALLRLGIRDERVMKGFDHIRSRIGNTGFPCFAAESMGRFRGPGRKGDPCPYANLIILRMLDQIPQMRESPEAETAVEMLLRHWEERKKKKYYLFGIGTDFAKPKAPRIWYDLLHYFDILTRFPAARRDGRLWEVADLLTSQFDDEGRIFSRSIWTKWRDWEFCQKREPSRWLTFLAHRALRRIGE